MVLLKSNDMLKSFAQLQPSNRMPLLCNLNRSIRWTFLTENDQGKKSKLKGLQTHCFDVRAASENNESYLTSLAFSEETGIVAVGSGSKEGNIYFIKDTLTAPGLLPNGRFRPIHKQSLGSPIYSLDWSGSHLLVGMNGGITRLYKVHFIKNNSEDEYEFDQLSLVGQYANPVNEIDLQSSKYTTNFHVKSAEFAFSYSFDFVDTHKGIPEAEIASFVPSHFLSLTANRISIWDALQENAPLSTINACDNPLNCASWSPNQPQSLVVCGGVDKELKIIDTRITTGGGKGIVWTTSNAHDRPIRDAKFNPFIPYWLASAGEDAIVNIWDIRATYHAPVAKIDGHDSIVTSISWSSTRPENILTTSFDGTAQFWALTPETIPFWDTHYRLADYSENDALPINYGSIIKQTTSKKGWSRQSNGYMYAKEMESWLSDEDPIQDQERSTMLLVGALGLGEWGRREPGSIYKEEPIIEARGPVVSIKPAKLYPGLYYCITNGGQLTSQSVRYDDITKVKCSHYQFDLDKKDDLVREIENDIYSRRIADAKRKLELLRSYAYDGEHEEDEKRKLNAVHFLEDCLEVLPPMDPASWNINSIPESLNTEEVNASLTDNDRWEYSIAVFKAELKYWNTRLPPGYENIKQFTTDTDDKVNISNSSINIADANDNSKNNKDLTIPHLSVSNSNLDSKDKDTESDLGESNAIENPLQIHKKNLSSDDVQHNVVPHISAPIHIIHPMDMKSDAGDDNEATSRRKSGLFGYSLFSKSPKNSNQTSPTTKISAPLTAGATESPSLTTISTAEATEQAEPIDTTATEVSKETEKIATKSTEMPAAATITKAETSHTGDFATPKNTGVSSYGNESTASTIYSTTTAEFKAPFNDMNNPFLTSSPSILQSTNPFENDMAGLEIQPSKNDDNQDRRSIKSNRSLESTKSTSSKVQGWLSLGLSRSRSRNNIDSDETPSKPKKSHKLNLFKHLKSRSNHNTDPGEKSHTTEMQNQSGARREQSNSTL